MEPNQQQNQEDYTELQENLDEIDPGVLNTPAREPKRIDKLMPNVRPDTFFHFNKPGKVEPQQDVVLDLGGSKKQLNTQGEELGASTKYLEDVFGDDLGGAKEINTNAIFIGFLVFVGLFFFILFNIKKAEQITKLEKELERMKGQSL
jgi:hypothetical protein